MRPRKNPDGLPPRVYCKHGAFYYVTRAGKWIRLGTDRDDAIKASAQVAGTPAALMTHLREIVLPTTRRNAESRGLGFSLSTDDVLETAIASDWKCAVTGAPFSLATVGRARRKPYAPSIDRVDCSIGYAPGNVRLVCVATNIALGDWGEDVFQTLALYYAQRLLMLKLQAETSKVLDSPIGREMQVVD